MYRRTFMVLIGAAVGWPLAAPAQQQRRIGYLRLAPQDATQLTDFRAGLAEAGYIEGRNLAIESRYAEGDYARLPEMAADLVRQSVEVVVCAGGTDAVKAAMQATTTTPIVGTNVVLASRPFEIVEHHNRPEGNVTGVAILTGDVMPKRLQMLAELVPGAAIGVLENPTYSTHDLFRAQIGKAAQTLKVELVFATASTDTDLDPAFASLASRHVGAILHEAEPFLGNSWRRLVLLADRHNVPMMQEWRHAVVAGGLISYAPSLRWVYQQVGRYTGQILRGVTVADLPVIAPTKIELIINLKTAKALGLAIPQSLLARADEVIE